MKELLEKLAKGEVTTEEVLKAIDDAEKDKVPRSRLNDKIEEVKELTSQLKERDDQLVELGKKAKDSDDLTAEIERLKQENADKDTEYQGRLQQQAFDAKLNDALRDAKVRNPKAVKALLDSERIKLDGEKLLGLDDQLTALKESDSYLFTVEEEPKLGGRNPNPNNQKPPAGMTPEKFKTLSYKELLDFKQTQPEQYEVLSKSE
ncbi:minor structural protein GP20 [Planomicrobium soli]|uniref:Minor structural protein GP20 n=1 Tax=Planomicrobium soli TaxID=1176648 RepID=A0A2P8H7E1_9BACL|nr:phage scaffolding protein [Planomicrobium soli]PSL42133.1 minor structural protein GP20 [Planomicrobium soli]